MVSVSGSHQGDNDWISVHYTLEGLQWAVVIQYDPQLWAAWYITRLLVKLNSFLFFSFYDPQQQLCSLERVPEYDFTFACSHIMAQSGP